MNNRDKFIFYLFTKHASDPEEVSIPWSLGTGLAAHYGSQAAHGFTSNTYLNALGGNSNGSDLHKSTIDDIKTSIKNYGFDIDSNNSPRSFGKLTPATSAVDMFKRKVHIPNDAHPGIWAHEAGHVFGGKPLMYGQIAGKGSSLLTTLFALLGAKDKSTADTAALAAGGLFGLGTLPSEIDASRRGFSMLRGLPFGSRLKSFIGLPTYLAAMTTPYLAVQGKNYMGGYNKPKA